MLPHTCVVHMWYTFSLHMYYTCGALGHAYTLTFIFESSKHIQWWAKPNQEFELNLKIKGVFQYTLHTFNYAFNSDCKT